MKELGINVEPLEYGAIVRFPLELSDSQVRRITAEFESLKWRTEPSPGGVTLRKDYEKIELGRTAAIVIAADPQVEGIRRSIEDIYRQTLDRALVFHLAGVESANSSVFNLMKRKFRSAVTDAYYASFNSLRAGIALLFSEQEAEKLEHPGLKNPDADPKDCQWNMKKRARWLVAVDKVLRAAEATRKEGEAGEHALKEIDHVVSWAKPIFDFEIRGDHGDDYDKVAKSTDEKARLLERCLSEHCFWLRIRADYRADFEVTTKTPMIAQAFYVAFAFCNLVSSIIKKEIAFESVIPDYDGMFSPSRIRGHVVDLKFGRPDLARKILLSDQVIWGADPDKPQEVFHARISTASISPYLRRIVARRRRARGDAAEAPGVSPAPAWAIAEESPGIRLELDRDGRFSLRSESSTAESWTLPLVLQDLVSAVRASHPESFTVLQGHRDALEMRSIRIQSRLEDISDIVGPTRAIFTGP